MGEQEDKEAASEEESENDDEDACSMEEESNPTATPEVRKRKDPSFTPSGKKPCRKLSFNSDFSGMGLCARMWFLNKQYSLIRTLVIHTGASNST